MKAIETTYKGYRFRSRLEARWAVFFDVLGIEWLYELEGFELADGTQYLPDFWLPRYSGGMWVEVKPIDDGFEKSRKFAAESKQMILLADGEPDTREFRVLVYLSGGVVESNDCFCDQYLFDEHRLFSSCGAPEDSSAQFNPIIADAVRCARSARFEFGENGEVIRNRDYILTREAWRARHPEANPDQYQAAVTDMAKKLGL